jgi:hypothetical protein
VGGPKISADGALGSRGAALLEPYSDAPETSGILLTEPDSLNAIVARAIVLGLQPAIHAIGDRGNRMALDAIEAATGRSEAASPAPASASRAPRIEHVQVVAVEDIPRFAELGVIASFQPTHATSDMYWAEERVGPERIKGAYAWRTFRDAGARIVCGSDFPVESPNPFPGLAVAMTRQDEAGEPPGGWQAHERVPLTEAFAAFTTRAAHAGFAEDRMGRLGEGLYADFIIVDTDIFDATPEAIRNTRVIETWVGGNRSWVRGAADAPPMDAPVGPMISDDEEVTGR